MNVFGSSSEKSIFLAKKKKDVPRTKIELFYNQN